MAFMGIFALSIFLMMFIIIVACVILFVFVPCLIIFIINLVKAINNKWPRHNTVAVVITSIVLSIIITIALAFLILIAIARNYSGQAAEATSNAEIALQYLLLRIKY